MEFLIKLVAILSFLAVVQCYSKIQPAHADARRCYRDSGGNLVCRGGNEPRTRCRRDSGGNWVCR